MPTQHIDYPFSGGVDEKTQSQLVEPGAALTVQNLRQLKNGSYQKRLGCAVLTTDLFGGGSAPVGKRLLGVGDERIYTDGLDLYKYGTTASAWKKALGYMPKLAVTDTPVAPLQYAVSAFASTYVNGYIVVTYSLPASAAATAEDAVFGAVIDVASGALVVGPVSVSGALAAGSPPKLTVVATGTRAVIVYSVDGAINANIYVTWIDTASSVTLGTGFSAPAAAITDANPVAGTANTFDACSLGGTNFAIAYTIPLVGTTGVRVRRFDSAITLLTTASLVSSVALGSSPSSVAVDANASEMFVAFGYNDTTSLRIVGLNAATLAVVNASTEVAVVSAAVVSAVSVLRTGTNAGFVIATGGTAGAVYSNAFTVPGGGGAAVPGTTHVGFNVGLHSKPFVLASRLYVGLTGRWDHFGAYAGVMADPYQTFIADMTQTLVDGTSGFSYYRVAGNVIPRTAKSGMGAATNILPCSVASISTTKVLMPVPALQNATSSSLNLVTMDSAGTNIWQSSVLGESMAIGGGPPSHYDGYRVAEIGFVQRPEVVSSVVAGAGTIPIGTYKYRAVYEQIDAKGQWHQSNVSDAHSVVLAGASYVTPTVRTLSVSNRANYNATLANLLNPVRIVLYRTYAGGSTYFRVMNSEVPNNPGAATQAMLRDEAVDTALGAPLYAQVEIPNAALVNVSPPPFSTMIAHSDRLFGAYGKTVWYTKQLTFGEGYAFCDNFQFDVETGGVITALASMDGALVVFKRDRIAFVDGSGPPDNGAGGDFSPPNFISADVGCIQPRSVVETPQGIMFQSLRGIEMLTRGRSLANYFGSRVEATLAANPVITSAVLDEAKGTVTFSCLPSEDSETGVFVTWDYVHNIWLPDLMIQSAGAKSSMMWGQRAGTVPARAWLRNTGGNLFVESTASYLDGGQYISGKIITPWLKMDGVEGYGRTMGCALLLESATACDVVVRLRLDYRSTVVQTRTFTAAEIAALRTPTELWMTFMTQKCSAFQLEMYDVTPSSGSVGTGQGPIWVGMRVEYKTKSGMNKASGLGR